MIRTAKFSDLESIALLEKECIECAWSEKVLEEAFLDASYKFFVCEKNEKIIGYGGVKQIFDEAEICNIAVSQDFRRQGVALKILDSIENYCKAKGIVKIFLEVNENNIAAILLYTNASFIACGERKNYYGKDSAILMQKILD